MNLNREDVVQSALNVQRWCKKHYKNSNFPFGDLICDCPFLENSRCKFYITGEPWTYRLEEFLRTRGIKENKIEEQKKKAKPWECHDCRYFPCLKNEDKPHRATCEHFELW